MKFVLAFILFPSFLFCQTYWQSIVRAENTCKYFLGQSEPPTNWMDNTFNDSSWASGIGGVGYGDNDDGTVINPVLSVYLRYEFNVTSKEDITSAILNADYDDSFIAYLNGEEIFRSNIDDALPRYFDQANTWHEAALYQGQQPEGYIFDLERLDLIRQGKNTLAFHVHNYEGTSSSDLTSNFYLHVEVPTSSDDYMDVTDWFILPLDGFQTPLPIIRINAGTYIPDEPKIQATLCVISNDNGVVNSSNSSICQLETQIAIERRGQSSLNLFPKNGFGFETRDAEGNDIDVSILGLPEEEDWILHGPYSDKTLMRNVLAMAIANKTGSYHSRTRFVELIIDDEYQGIYVLMEKIKRDKNRIDIAKVTPEDIEGDELTGGYVFKIDKDGPDWFSRYNTYRTDNLLQFQLVTPSRNQILNVQRDYIRSYVDSFEVALKSPDFRYGGKRYDEYIDLESFADHLLIKELAKDVDAYRISSYYYKDKDSKDGKLHAGPVWDFNLGFRNADYCDGNSTGGWIYNNPDCNWSIPFWWHRMLEDPVFVETLQCRWEENSKSAFNQDTILNLIDRNVELLQPALQRNFQKWPILNMYIWPNPEVRGSYENEITALKSFIRNRLLWMDNQLNESCNKVNTENIEDREIAFYPNPFDEAINIQLPQITNLPINIKVYDALGHCVLSERINTGTELYKLKTEKLTTGIYFLHLSNEHLQLSRKLIK